MDKIDAVYLRLRALQYRRFVSVEDDPVRAALFAELAIACERGDSRWEQYVFRAGNHCEVTLARHDPSATPGHEPSAVAAD